MELEEEGVPISVTLVKPASIDTPFFEKAKTYLGVEPQPVPPVYAPEVVVGGDSARRRSTRSENSIAGGSGAKLSAAPVRSAAGRPVHGALDVRLPEHRTARRTGPRDNLYAAGGRRRRRARPPLVRAHARVSSVYTKAMLHPRAAAAVVLVGLAAGAALAHAATSGRGRSG